MKKVFALLVLAGLLTGCGSAQVEPLIVQKAVATRLGLASSDEVTLTNIKEGEKNGIGGHTVTLVAKTARNKQYNCSYFVTPALTPLQQASMSDLECKAK